MVNTLDRTRCSFAFKAFPKFLVGKVSGRLGLVMTDSLILPSAILLCESERCIILLCVEGIEMESLSCFVRFTHLVPYGAKYYSYLVARAAASLIWNSRFRDEPFSKENGRVWAKVSCILISMNAFISGQKGDRN